MAAEDGATKAGDSAGYSSGEVPAAAAAEDGLLRFDFDETEKLLGLRLSPEVPPVVLAVKPDSAGALKGVPEKGAIHQINGHPLLTSEDKKAIGDLMTALKARPLTLLVSDPTAPAKPALAPAVQSAAAAAAGGPEDEESDGDSSASEAQADDRTAADLALLQSAQQPSRPAGKAARSKPALSDDSGEDSGDDVAEKTKDVSADRFDRDMGLLHKAAQRAPVVAAAGTSPEDKPSSPGGQLEDDEALARRLQEELDLEDERAAEHADAEQEVEAHSDEGPHVGSDTGDDELLARQLQEEYDMEAAAAELQVQAQSAAYQPARMPPSSPAKTKQPAEADLNPFGNLLGEPVAKLYDESTWTQRQRKLATIGALCMKVGRNGKSYKRTFWMSEGYLWTDGKGTRRVAVAELTGVFRGNRSEEFQKMAQSSGGLFSRAKKQDANVCCVLTTADRTFSLYFTTSELRDEFVETIAWYTQRLTWA